MLTNEQIKAIKKGFERETENESAPIYKSFSSDGVKWLVCANHSKGVVTWYEDREGKTVKYFDYI